MIASRVWLVAIFLFMFAAFGECDDEGYSKIGDVSVPDSMEVVKEGDVNVLLPKGGQLKKESSFLVKEVPDEYASRKFMQMDGYFNDMRRELEAQRAELKELRGLVEKLLREKNTQTPPRQ